MNELDEGDYLSIVEAAVAKQFAQRMPEKELYVDWAQSVAAHGGSYIPCKRDGVMCQVASWFASSTRKRPNPPSIVLKPTVRAGQCWATRPTTGYIVFKLTKPIIPTRFILEHIHHKYTPDYTTAPKKFQVWASNDVSFRSKMFMGEFEYEGYSDSTQAFQLQAVRTDEGTEEEYFSYIRLEMLSNRGAPYTCLYGINVHGTPKIDEHS